MEDRQRYLKTSFGGRQSLIEDKFYGRQPWMEDKHKWKTTENGRWVSMEDGHWSDESYLKIWCSEIVLAKCMLGFFNQFFGQTGLWSKILLVTNLKNIAQSVFWSRKKCCLKNNVYPTKYMKNMLKRSFCL